MAKYLKVVAMVELPDSPFGQAQALANFEPTLRSFENDVSKFGGKSSHAIVSERPRKAKQAEACSMPNAQAAPGAVDIHEFVAGESNVIGTDDNE